MELIKKNYQLIISCGFILFGFVVFIAILIVKPSRTILEETYTYNQKPELKTVEFPFSQSIKIPNNNPSFIELRFGDDSINQYQYTITAINESTPFFNHVYNDELSNIVRIPIDYSIIKSAQDNNITIRIDCENNCEKAKLELYDIDGMQTIKTLYGIQKVDYGLLWYGLFPIAIGLTLLPLTKRGDKNA